MTRDIVICCSSKCSFCNCAFEYFFSRVAGLVPFFQQLVLICGEWLGCARDLPSGVVLSIVSIVPTTVAFHSCVLQTFPCRLECCFCLVFVVLNIHSICARVVPRSLVLVLSLGSLVSLCLFVERTIYILYHSITYCFN